MLSSSKNPYGSKTLDDMGFTTSKLSSSKNPYGSKTKLSLPRTATSYLLAKIHMVAKL